MAGLPAGYEDEFSDDDFDFNDESYREYYQDSNRSNNSAVKNESLLCVYTFKKIFC